MPNRTPNTKPRQKRWLKWLPALLGVVALAAAVLLAVFLAKHFQQDKPEQKKMVQQVTILTPPPPPPPPPKEELEQPEVKEDIPEEPIEEAVPEAGPDAAPGQDLGVDAEGGAGGDGFGLVAKKGGRGLLGGGGYEQFVRQEINEAILEDSRLKHLEYVAVLNLQIGAGGEFESIDVELVSGDAEALALLKKLLAQKHKLSRARPLEAAGGIKLRIKSVL